MLSALIVILIVIVIHWLREIKIRIMITINRSSWQTSARPEAEKEYSGITIRCETL